MTEPNEADDLLERAKRWAMNTGWDGNPNSVPMRLIAENAALRERLAEREWQPIETAPKDGAMVDLRAGPIINLGCVWESTPKGGRWIIAKGDYYPSIEPHQWRLTSGEWMPGCAPLTGGDNAQG